MDESTIQRLNAINREFYRITAQNFDDTRGTPWLGWEPLVNYLPNTSTDAPFSVLDIGCGNGRFGVFLAERLRVPLLYHGIDSSTALLESAQQSLKEIPLVQIHLQERDVIESPPDTGLYDLVVLFGVMHHIPSSPHRQALMAQMAERVQPGGMLVFACWRFYEYERFRKRIVLWDEDLAQLVEPHDYLLDWRRGEVALRYCHYVDDTEHTALVAASGLEEILTYRADGFTGDVNAYSILHKPLTPHT